MAARSLGRSLFGVLACAGLLAGLDASPGAAAPPGLRVQTLPPYITSLDPDKGGVGTVVSIGGMNFTGATRVVFNEGHSANFKVVSDTEIKTTVPLGTISGPVSVETPTGTAKSQVTFEVPIG